jgi:hypothetical protein
MKIILLMGPPRSQKTTTLNMLYALLTQGLSNPPPKMLIQNIPAPDFECVIPYNGKNVAIFSMGDILYRTYDAIIKYCPIADVLIIAHSTSGNGKMRLFTSVNAYPQHYVVVKTTNNAADCQNIISKI